MVHGLNLTTSLAEKVDFFQRKLLRKLMGIKWSDKISNKTLYIINVILPLHASVQVLDARWRAMI